MIDDLIIDHWPRSRTTHGMSSVKPARLVGLPVGVGTSSFASHLRRPRL